MVAHPPARRYVLEGRVVTMGSKGVLDDAAIYVDDGMIEAVLAADAPPPDSSYRDVPRIRTGGTILPGFIELHNHLAYNAMPLWDVPRRYSNNGQWRGIESYTRDVTKPAQVLGQTDGVAQALVRYSECRALLGGATTSQGITLANASGIRSYYRGLVRSAEQPDDDRLPSAGTSIANPSTGGALDYLDRLSGHTCYLQHLAEGTDDTARGWWKRLRIDDGNAWAVTDALCGIHSTALHEDDFQVMAERGATMVWSPVSNYLLYGETTDMAAAKAAGMTISLGCDWAPSGAKNLLGELKVAWLASERMGGLFTPRELVAMVTINPARSLKWDELLGTIEAGRIADLVVFHGRSGDPYRTVLEARESTITLAMIDGVPRVGQPRLMGGFWEDDLDDAGWIDHITIDRSERLLYLEDEGDLLDGLPLSAAIERLSDAMERLPQLAADVDAAVGIGNAIDASGHVTFGGGMQADGETFRVVPDFEQEDEQAAIATLGFALASQPYAFWVTEPIALDPITVIDDRQHLRALLAARNLPEYVKKGLPGLYGRTLAIPESGRFLEDADQQVDPDVLATTADLHGLLTSFGELSLAQRKRIVDQALIVLEDNYVHLPLKKAMHAVDPLQRLRLLRHRLDAMTDATMPPEIEFHEELTAIFTSVRDLHTGYRLPVPFGTKIAWLPFLIEQVNDRGASEYLLTHWVADAWPDDAMRGARVTHWNGMPIEVAVTRNGDRHAGSNPDARHARGLSSLTIRPLAAGFPPDEDWVTLRWVDGDGQAHEHHQEWLVFEPGAEVGPSALATEATRLGVDDRADAIQQARKMLYAPAVSMAERAANGQFVSAAITDAAAELESHLPGVFRAMTVRPSDADDGPTYGYVRIFTFHVPSADAFVDEFVRLVRQLPHDGLIIDVRGNGGGLITAAEELLQVLTPHHIEPEPAQFINSPLNLKLCRNHRESTRLPGLELRPWIDSMELSLRTAATYSLGFPITTPADANARGQAYYGPSVLITDPLCYSATDMFAAGFQDHGIGPVIGVGGATGAGGANVWQHGLLRLLMQPDNDDPGPSPYEPLPGGADLRVAIRRTTRVGANAGMVLEDLGVQPDLTYRMTRRDVLERNRDLLDTAIGELRGRRPHVVEITSVRRHRDRAPTVRLRTRNVERVDARAGTRWLRSQQVARGRVTLELDEVLAADEVGEPIHLEVVGHRGDEAVARLRTTIDPQA